MCRNCGKRNHFANVFRSSSSKGTYQIEAEAEGDDDNDNNNKQFFNIGFLVNCNSLKSKINAYLTAKDYASVIYKILFNHDTGAEVNIVPKKFIDKMSLTLDATKITLSGIGNGIVKPCGKVILDCFNDNDECHSLLFYVSDKIDHAIFGAKACFDLNFLKRVETCHKHELKTPLLLPDICNVCCKFQNEHQRKPMISHEIPNERFYKVDVSDSINAEQSRQQFYYNKRSKKLKPLKKGEKVNCKQGNRRDEVVVVDFDAKRRSYTVENRNGFIRRNRRHLFHAPSNANFNSNDLCADIDYNYFNDSQSAVNNQCNFRRSRFARRLIILVDLMIMCKFLVVVKTRKKGDVTYCLCLNNIVN